MPQKNVIQLRKNPRFGDRRRDSNRPDARTSRAGRSNGRSIASIVVWGVVIAVACWGYFGLGTNLDRIVSLAKTPEPDALSASFSICNNGRRNNCVVDGDTFWFHGEKIRIADIDTPELSPPRCSAERVKGEAAKARLLVLLNAGTFSLVAGYRDEDQYGRKLRTVMRRGQSIGGMLVEEQLARTWDGARHSWCSL